MYSQPCIRIFDMSTSGQVNDSMLDLFKIEVETQLKKATPFLDELSSAESIEGLQAVCRALKGAIKLVNIEIALPIVDSVDQYLAHCSSTSTGITTEYSQQLHQVFELLEAISTLDKESLENPSAELNTRIENALFVIPQTIPEETHETSDVIDTPQPVTMEISFSPAPAIDPSMFVLFITELDNSINTLSSRLLELETSDKPADALESLMRASHSIKGAARMIGIDSVVKVSHAMEDVFVAAQNKSISLQPEHIDIAFKCCDILTDVSKIQPDAVNQWTDDHAESLHYLITALTQIHSGNYVKSALPEPAAALPAEPGKDSSSSKKFDTSVRVDAGRINRLINLAGELTVSSNWIRQHSDSMLTMKRKHNEILKQIDRVRSLLSVRPDAAVESSLIVELQHTTESLRDSFNDHLFSLDGFDRRSNELSSQINHEIINSRMRPFKDTAQAYKRMVRDISNSLNKKVELQIDGEDTAIDRDILEKLDAPINHMLRNAIDHGIESPDERLALGKPETGHIKLSAQHHAGRLLIHINDDGRGVDTEKLRQSVLEKKLVNEQMAKQLSKSELLDFLFLPSFSTRKEVTELSGRGVGLDIVHSTLQEVRGSLHADSELGKGMQINMELPLTLSVLKSLLVNVREELYAFPLANIQTVLHISKDDISAFENKQYFTFNEQNIGLVHCSQLLGLENVLTESDTIPVVVIGDWNLSYGLVVDDIVGEKKLAIRTLNKKLGKIKDISTAALTDDGEPVLVFDVDDLMHSIDDIIEGKKLYTVTRDTSQDQQKYKRVLIVDDSLTVREVEKKLLESRGYHVDTAIDGVDGWNTLKSTPYDLVISDIDMPRMNGIELIRMIKNDAALRNTPVIMVSYKDRPEDKIQGLEVGADYYLTKGSFHDDTLIQAVNDLIGDALIT